MKYAEELTQVYGERMHRSKKKAFREFALKAAEESGFSAKVDSNIFAKNVVIGDPEKAEYILTAHYDTPPTLPKFFVKHMLIHSFITLPLIILGLTYGIPFILTKIPFFLRHSKFLLVLQKALTYGVSAVMLLHIFGFLGNANKKNFNDNTSGVLTLLNIMDKLKKAPQKVKDKFCFVLTDNEEKFLLGGLSFARKYKGVLKNQKFINVDCVGRGKQINAYYSGSKQSQVIDELKALQSDGYIVAPKRSGLMSMSDHIAFSKYNHVTLLSVNRKNHKSLYSQIHSSNDNKINTDNVDYISTKCAKIMLENLIKSGKIGSGAEMASQEPANQTRKVPTFSEFNEALKTNPRTVFKLPTQSAVTSNASEQDQQADDEEFERYW